MLDGQFPMHDVETLALRMFPTTSSIVSGVAVPIPTEPLL